MFGRSRSSAETLGSCPGRLFACVALAAREVDRRPMAGCLQVELCIGIAMLKVAKCDQRHGNGCGNRGSCNRKSPLHSSIDLLGVHIITNTRQTYNFCNRCNSITRAEGDKRSSASKRLVGQFDRCASRTTMSA